MDGNWTDFLKASNRQTELDGIGRKLDGFFKGVQPSDKIGRNFKKRPIVRRNWTELDGNWTELKSESKAERNSKSEFKGERNSKSESKSEFKGERNSKSEFKGEAKL